MPPATLTLSTRAELAEAVALINASYRGESSRQGWANEADYIDGERTSQQALDADLAEHPGAGLYLLRDEPTGPLLGCVWLEPYGEGIWYLGLLTVRPDLQDRRLGRAMLDEVESMVRERGGSVMRMTVVHLRDSLIAWYNRRGYAQTGEILPFPHADPPRDDLCLVVLEKEL
jgi:ribosomal protein S18 acetylase RimI-like enzyme